jgi:hypothetical protein
MMMKHFWLWLYWQSAAGMRKRRLGSVAGLSERPDWPGSE